MDLLSIAGTLGTLEVFLVYQVIDGLLDMRYLWHELRRDHGNRLLNKRLMSQGLEPKSVS